VVKIHVVAGPTDVRIEVRDNGKGIPEGMRDHVFEPYTRGRKRSTQPASVGLELAVARKLAQLMKGDLELSREENWIVFSLSHCGIGKPTNDRAAVATDRLPVGTPQ
jgi:signal transduction histidine kinase